jgi:tRNA pseudouridine32 synthase / 23S rRNA pseudouridine746 synthase
LGVESARVEGPWRVCWVSLLGEFALPMVPLTSQPPDTHPGLQVLHADDACIVVVKPPGLPTVPGRTAQLQDCLWRRLQGLYSNALVVHRLDMATSGIVVFARGIDAQRRLSSAFETRQVDKAYEAWVEGRLLQADANDSSLPLLIDLPLAADWPNRPRQRVDALHGRASQTEVRVLAWDAQGLRTRVHLVPRTGRTHQLRVHLAAVGHPIVGDALYRNSPASPSTDPGGPTAPATEPARLLLHATRLALSHPITGQPQVWHSAPPF